MDGLAKLAPDQRVMFKLTLPTQSNSYLPLICHPNTVRVVALSGGYNRADSCKVLSQNVGMIASFSRAFAEGLNAKQSDADFRKTIDESCEAIFQASRRPSDKEFKMAKVEHQNGFSRPWTRAAAAPPRH
eukprot:SRR837773.11908.p1 GENE.SRR837773.11908~~SRR837773.11908.p1  ORF type:complete len:137 (-),score=49.11 SRR837773.11908:146-535(-)